MYSVAWFDIVSRIIVSTLSTLWITSISTSTNINKPLSSPFSAQKDVLDYFASVSHPPPHMSVCSWSSQHLSVSQSDSLYSFDSPPVIEKYGATLKCFPMPKCQVISVRPSADSLISASSIPSFHWHLLSLKICH